MKKIGFYSFLVAVLLITGCAQKEMKVVEPKTSKQTSSQKTSEDLLDSMPFKEEVTVLEEVVYVADEVSNGGVYVTINGKRVFLKNVYFAFNKYDISPEMREVIKDNAMLLSNYDGTFRVEGNTDDWGTDEYNYALSLKRAKAVKDALVSEGLDDNSIKLISYGESNPVCLANTKECWQKNRRAEFRLNQ